jgi:hypothetical protein
MELTELRGTGSVEVEDRSLVLKAERYLAVKRAEDALTKERKALGAELKEAFIALGHEQMTFGGEPVLAVDVSYSQTYDLDYLARRAPVAFAKAHKPREYFLKLNSSGKVR